MAELYLDTSEDTSSQEIPVDKMLPIIDCDKEHLWNLENRLRTATLKTKNRKCVKFNDAVVSGGTMDGDTENIVVI